jgi:hypothetical protein
VYGGGLAFVAAVGGYYVLREHYNPGYLQAVYVNELFGRYVEGLGSMRGPFLLYLDVIRTRDPYWWYFLPPAFLVGVLAGSGQIRRLSVFSLIAVISFWLTISFGRTKIEWYALPLYPFFALQIGIALGLGWERLVPALGAGTLGRTAAVVIVAALFYQPFARVAPYVLEPADAPGDAELHAQARYLQQRIREGSNLQDYVFCYRGYNGPANFYVKVLHARGSNVQARDRVTDLAAGTHVVVSQAALRDEVEHLYELEPIGERFGCVASTVHAIRHDEGGAHFKVLRATYGANCGAPSGNATSAVQRDCADHTRCNFIVNVSDLGDPAPGCAKQFDVEWQCEDTGERRAVTVPAEAGFGSMAQLDCAPR